ncbi:hypothetical protein AWB80_01678 [Caballeronia pedi]|uniref:PD-(D/E)XK motif protein n=1 Tax=Caballeronia pedi TaxID=1777141 RepID=A0A158A1F4_9BURK|nr:PD-(D/E)XK motif protein [Caballeronia pedi]SAK51654.1 hypothetical protein AWB80_01678 [Caballeronia pedi]
MMATIEDLWRTAIAEVSRKPIEPNGFRLTRIHPESRFDIYAGVDESAFVLLAIGIHATPPSIATDSASLDYFRQQRLDSSWLMVLRLRKRGLEPVFGRLCQDLLDAAESVPDENTLVSLFKERLNLWKKLFQDGGDGFLQQYKIKGLIAELLVLETLVHDGMRGANETVTGWTGPLATDQDFVYSDCALEVKAIGPGAENVSISSLEQLDCRVPMHLILVTLRQAASSEPAAIGLNKLVARIEGAIAGNADALKTFKERLLEASYFEHEYYDSILFEPLSMLRYRIADAFPKLTRGMVPLGVSSATYAISLCSISDFEDGSPA